MMSPERQRARLKSFLKEKTSIYNDILHGVARKRLEIISAHMKKTPDYDNFFSDHYAEIEQEADKVLDELCWEIIPAKQYKYLFTQISIFAIFLLPPVYPLIRYAASIWRQSDFSPVEFSVCVASVLLLLMLMCAAAYAVFTTSFPKK